MMIPFYDRFKDRMLRVLTRLECGAAAVMSVGCVMVLLYGAVELTGNGDMAPLAACRPGVSLMSNILPDVRCF